MIIQSWVSGRVASADCLENTITHNSLNTKRHELILIGSLIARERGIYLSG